MTVYKKLQYNGSKIQVDSAVRDGNGAEISNKYQVKLVSGTNIKTINGNSLLGSGDITIQSGGGGWELAENQDITNYVSWNVVNGINTVTLSKSICIMSVRKRTGYADFDISYLIIPKGVYKSNQANLVFYAYYGSNMSCGLYIQTSSIQIQGFSQTTIFNKTNGTISMNYNIVNNGIIDLNNASSEGSFSVGRLGYAIFVMG